MHQAVARALDEIDAAVFSGDTFSTSRKDFNLFKETVERWSRALPDIERELVDFENQILNRSVGRK